MHREKGSLESQARSFTKGYLSPFLRSFFPDIRGNTRCNIRQLFGALFPFIIATFVKKRFVKRFTIQASFVSLHSLYM